MGEGWAGKLEGSNAAFDPAAPAGIALLGIPAPLPKLKMSSPRETLKSVRKTTIKFDAILLAYLE